ncbi:MAG: 2-hydroxy-3-oxopropionate reductase [Gemmatimonadetes bacterium]|nr:2-hydroxy-3-oxopropionate reductase [Gemmatimonadota bacterium]MYK51920.1 2-hydroxy-3-oxopropionate reductase [Gemmatimonadota bacterium]
MSKPKIGFIGLGIMGKPMAGHLIDAGYELVVHNRNRDAVDELVGKGAAEAHSGKEVAAQSDIVITMLPDSPDVESVALGEGGIIEGAHEGLIFVDMSTIAPSVTTQVGEVLAEKGVQSLDAPVSGGDIGAQNATLSIMVGGAEDTFNTVKPLFDVMGQSAILCGPLGAGQTVKACNQILVAVTIAGVSEALTMGTKAGVDPIKIVQVLSGGLARCGVLENRGERMVNGDFDPGFRIRLHYKDLNIIQKTSNDFGVPLPVTSEVFELFKTAMIKGRGELDHSGLLTVIEEMSNIQARTGQ